MDELNNSPIGNVHLTLMVVGLTDYKRTRGNLRLVREKDTLML